MRPNQSRSSFHVALVGTYPPTQCGLATYTANVGRSLARHGWSVDVVRSLGADEVARPRPAGVVAEWRRGDLRGPRDALIAANEADVVLLQHEFGIYPGADGADVLTLAAACRPPLVTVFHTVRAEPSPHQRAIVEELAGRSETTVVHGCAARTRLLAHHAIDPDRVVIIPHGAMIDTVSPAHTFRPKPTMLTWGLLGPGKGVEYGIEAVARLRRDGLELPYVIAGQTHPNVRSAHGETYRSWLQELATTLGVADLVTFDDQYRDWPAQLELVKRASIVLLPYDSRDQVTSGVLVEALAAGKPVVATAFPHAVELESSGAVRVVPHADPLAIADTLGDILRHPAVRHSMETAARAEGAHYDWCVVGQRYSQTLADAIGATDAVEWPVAQPDMSGST